MSLLKRLWLSVLGAMLLALGVSFVVSVLTARNYLEQQLFAQASDGAASLALSMSQQSKDAAMSELLVTALFDSGHFESIVYRDVQGKVLAERRTSAPAPTAPAWFVALVPLDARPGEALVSDGWRQAGSVEVRASARYAYGELWAGILKLALTQGLVGLLLCAVVAVLMRWLQKPLKGIVEQAEAIGQRRFEIQPLPNVPELRVVGAAMNKMVDKVKAMFAEQAARIEALRQEVSHDSLTGIPGRSLFMGSLRAALSDERVRPSGLLMLVRLRDLAAINRSLGRRETDELLRSCARALLEILPALPLVDVAEGGAEQETLEALVARLNGAEFGLMCPGLTEVQARLACDRLVEAFERLRANLLPEQGELASIGWTLYQRGEQLADVLARLDNYVMQAETGAEPVAGGLGDTRLPPLSSDGWLARLETALRQNSFHLATYPVRSAQGRELHLEAMLRMRDESGSELTAGQFMPAAARLGLTARLDVLTLKLALEKLQGATGEVAINVSPQSLRTPGFVDLVQRELQQAGDTSRRLWVEISERGLTELGGLESLVMLAEVLRRAGCKIGIEHFGRQINVSAKLQDLRLDYLKLDGAFVVDIDHNPDHQRFVKALVDVALGLDIVLIAERVTTAAEAETLRQLGVAGLTGPAIRLLD
ncbi:EAL domain-containing protein [Uliginosibacterium aquaticum]|uniref:EAL domain-containing protein n=1 Tax=Uliginosibacterium aquaticum TaxID=2731212 RepID=A0ABX2IIX2_9RHOO|nr:EAL domain-containing protein [Uliginosibacterium aquaticum]NSL54281.1 EAL domain-containing protein [Uliginosibacterium aquaticum]